MTQKSYPWPGVSPASGADAGRYTAPEWWGEWAAEQLSSGIVVTSPLLRTDPTFTNIGVHYSVANRLAVTSPANNQITIATGAWKNDGQFGYNDTALAAIAITSPAANPRIDRVVIRKNFTGNTYTPTNAAALTVPPYTARITVISGAEAGAPVAPSLVQDTARNPAGAFGTDGTWDIPLAQYEISVGGVISSLTDEREWIDAQQIDCFVPALVGRNSTDGTDIALDANQAAAGALHTIPLPDNKVSWADGSFIVPANFFSDLTVKTVVWKAAAASTTQVYANTSIMHGACGEVYNAHNPVTVIGQHAMVDTDRNCIDELSLPDATVGDLANIQFGRNATNVLDTVGATVYVLGFVYSYLGWKR